MKHKGSISQIYYERDRSVLPKLIRQAKHLATYPTTMGKLCRIAAELPTDKYYIADDAACIYVYKRYLHNIVQKFVSPYKRRLYDALYEEVERMMKKEKYKTLGLKNTIILALNKPAPCVGMTPRGIENRISKIRCMKKNDKV